jgi:hypothetical protein
MNYFIVQVETGSPGMTVAVSIDGKIVWAEGISLYIYLNYILFCLCKETVLPADRIYIL